MSNVYSRPVLVADIGGTNARFAAVDLETGHWRGQWTGPVKEHSTIASALRQALAELPKESYHAVCIAIAGPVGEEWVKVSNGDWAFSPRDLQAQFGWSHLSVINDFHAAAYGAVNLEPGQVLPVGKRSDSAAASRLSLPSAVIGPGTGLGVAALLPEISRSGDLLWTAHASEGGHARFAPGDEEEDALLTLLRRKLGNVQREDLLSGRGLCNLYWALAEIRGENLKAQTDPALITAEALADSNSHSAAVLQRFCAILGSVAADVALDLGTRGSLFLAGGILPRISDFLLASSFRQRFEDHLQFHHYLATVDTLLITEARLGLLGAAYYLKRHLDSDPDVR